MYIGTLHDSRYSCTSMLKRYAAHETHEIGRRSGGPPSPVPVPNSPCGYAGMLALGGLRGTAGDECYSRSPPLTSVHFDKCSLTVH